MAASKDAPGAAKPLLMLGRAEELDFATPDACGFAVHAESTVSAAAAWAATQGAKLRAVVVKLGAGHGSPDSGLDLIHQMRDVVPHALRVVYSYTAVSNVLSRQHCIDAGAHMVTADPASLLQVLRQVAAEGTGSGGGVAGPLTCPQCGFEGLSEDELWTHMPLFHVNDEDQPPKKCMLCGKRQRNLYTHYHNAHGPSSRGEHHADENGASELYPFALVVCRRKSDGKFLLTQEFANVGFWLPGGRVDSGESFQAAAERETLEEAGVAVHITGVLRVEFSPHTTHSRMRVIFLAEPVDEAQPAKSVPDYESGGAAWVDWADVASAVAGPGLVAATSGGGIPARAHRDRAGDGAGAGAGAGAGGGAADPVLRLRGPEPREWFRYVSEGGPAFPLSMLTVEGAPAPGAATVAHEMTSLLGGDAAVHPEEVT